MQAASNEDKKQINRGFLSRIAAAEEGHNDEGTLPGGSIEADPKRRILGPNESAVKPMSALEVDMWKDYAGTFRRKMNTVDHGAGK